VRLISAFDARDGQIHLEMKPGSKSSLPDNEVALVLDKGGTFTGQILGQISKSGVIQLIKTYNVVLAAGKGDADAAMILKKIELGNAFAGQGKVDMSGALAGLPPVVTHAAETIFGAALPDSPAALNGGSVDYLFYSTLIMVKDQPLGTLIVGVPRVDETQLRNLLWTLLLATPATLLLSAIGGYWLATRAMRPVRVITRAANEISESELDRRLNLRGRDELGELGSTFDRMLNRLEAAFKRQRQFTTDASHELRTPLTIVNLEVSRALACPRTPQEYRQALAIIQAENEQMSHLVNDLLVLARADTGRQALGREEIDLSDLALEVVERLDTLAREKGVELTTGDLPELKVEGDWLYLGRMLTNLVENAIKYTSRAPGAPGGKAQVRVETGSNLDGQRAEAWVRVSDNGPGIAAEHLPHLFDRFYRVDKARTSPEGGASPNGSGADPGGSGLGLSIVQWVAQAHGGQALVESEPGLGSVFEVRLPLCKAVASPEVVGLRLQEPSVV
jgi:heavy metal sensor kinase